MKDHAGLTHLNFDPWRSSTIAMHYSVHEKLLPSNERIALLAQPSDWLPPAFHPVELT